MLSFQPTPPLDTVPAPPLHFADRTHQMVPSETRALFSMAAREDVVSLAGGMPSPEALPAQALREVLQEVFDAEGASALQYGSAQGDPVLREQICRVMAAEGIGATPDEVLVTVGSQQALDLVTRVFVNPGDTVVTEGPTYVTALSTFAAHQARVVEVAMDRDGVVPQALADTFALLAAEGRPATFFYTVPTFHNPTGRVLGADRRAEVLEICRRAGVLLVEDNPYGLLHFGERPHRALCADAPDGVVYLGSFSKTLAPGLRVGWARAPRAVTAKLVLAAESAMLSHSKLAQRAVSRFLDTRSWQGHLDVARSLYRGRRDAMLEELAATMPDGVSWTVPAGGFFVWLTLPAGLDARAMMPRAVDGGVAYVPGTGFHTRGGGRNVRLSYSYPTAGQVREGVRRLSEVIRDEAAGGRASRLSEAVAR
ncbi:MULTISPECIES: PLP-dependent aminotransferase family protein [unclassified Streptomyces]|uniref:aminotransferase-like domain-containing protein n=1 Tax=unclassified Streptomyces TaxID=2593676 RepID=UPI0001C1CA97|nr:MULTISPECIES: PLP-dependent aminotransferase family protein [unclassified Streptomyces]AEN10076.1 putative transcriptional regulator, GntR family [Streptomyces sp. SirexAA-E]MYR67062.1 aminotransferase class I/II-fold pyridoxal phosphate-dependent enzyme [Streptomyces sp. SID4939]MYS04009.1 aminotransferase class I/II-fold pyridoxal phosphate-dependent enzyme [Streptomyces sp. SID4940]MYT66138.1 aminotransferase class I/II-fold pyridoxal phosphate-dependent enzyme [Streptomyces sp. SID8357]